MSPSARAEGPRRQRAVALLVGALSALCVPPAVLGQAEAMQPEMAAAVATMAEMPGEEYRETMQAAARRDGTCPMDEAGNHSLGIPETCSKMDLDRWNLTTQLCNCRPRETIVSLLNMDTPNMLMPSVVLVRRCSGWCSAVGLGHSCIATRTESRSHTVFHVNDAYQYGCGSVEVQEDTDCACGCPLTADDCTDRQEFLAERCMCRCKKTAEYRRGCGAGRRWDHQQCRCACERHGECSTGLGWSGHYCRCLPMMMPTDEDLPPAYDDNSVRYN